MSNKSEGTYQICTKTVMDNIADPGITFDQDGVCNYWHEHHNIYAKQMYDGEEGKKLLETAFEKVRKAGKGKQYDCIIGLSGGVDSTYIAYLVKQHGLRPLAIHFDNGWNSKIAVRNIQNIINYLQCDLHTLVVDWEEFKDLQLAYLKASVIDIEALTDHAIYGALYKQAAKYNVKHIISGTNYATESILPSAWIFNKLDAENIKDIHRQYGTKKLKTYPFFSAITKQYYLKFKKLEFLAPINFQEYNKEKVKKLITEEIGWQDYGGKHFESLFTKFYQSYILPVKFKVDKRKAHLSNLICTGQMTREEALEELKQPPYDEDKLQEDKIFVAKKFGLTLEEFDAIMQQPQRSHLEFKTEGSLDKMYPFLKPVKKVYSVLKRS